MGVASQGILSFRSHLASNCTTDTTHANSARSDIGARMYPHQSAPKWTELVTTVDTGLERRVREASGRVVGTPESDEGVPVAGYAVVRPGSGAVSPATGCPPVKVPGGVSGTRGERSEPREASLGTNAVIVSSEARIGGRSPAPARRAARRKWERGLSKADRIRRRFRSTAQRVAPAGSNRAKCGRVPVTERIQVAEGISTARKNLASSCEASCVNTLPSAGSSRAARRGRVPVVRLGSLAREGTRYGERLERAARQAVRCTC